MGRPGDNAPIVDIEGSLVAELQKLDLTLNEARILIFLMTHGHSSASDISRHTGIQRTETYNYVSGLLSKGVIFSTFDRPQKYYSLPLEEVVDSLVQAKMNELGAFETKKKEYHDMMEALVGNRAIKQEDKERYNVVMGENAINARIGRMLAEAKEEVQILVTDRNLVNFYHAGITDQFIQLTAKGVYVNLRTPCKNVGDYISANDVKLKTTDKMVPTSFVIVDGRELMILLESQPFKKSEQCCFYTNNLSLVSVFKFLFDSVM